jgi:hypothetical protein
VEGDVPVAEHLVLGLVSDARHLDRVRPRLAALCAWQRNLHLPAKSDRKGYVTSRETRLQL